MSDTLILLQTIQPEWDLSGDPVSLLGYPGNPQGYRTMLIHESGFTGSIGLEASLEINPKNPEDWFPIMLSANSPYAVYQGVFNPSIYFSNRPYTIHKYDIVGKFTWLRAKFFRGIRPDGLLNSEITYQFGFLYKIEVTK